MTSEQARQIAERIGKAKDELMDALAIAERSNNAKLAGQIGILCGKAETLQNKVSSLQRKDGPSW